MIIMRTAGFSPQDELTECDGIISTTYSELMDMGEVSLQLRQYEWDDE